MRRVLPELGATERVVVSDCILESLGLVGIAHAHVIQL